MMRRLAGLLLLSALSPGGLAQQEVAFAQAPSERLPAWNGYGEQVEAILQLPAGAEGRVPAVVLFHSAAGHDPAQYEFYGAALREAGIATLGVVLFRSGSRRHVPSDLVPHAFGSLRYLAAHPRIDPDRIGITGFSLGGILAMYTASAMLADEHLGNGPRFAAHMPVYPVCWVHEGVARGAERQKRIATAYTRLTGAPVHVLAGGKDQLDGPDGCQEFMSALAPEARKHVSLTFFPGATHSWDVGRSYQYFDRAGCKGKGCQVEVEYDRDAAQKGRQAMVDFFASSLIRRIR
jgi:dienelactone hydrolase